MIKSNSTYRRTFSVVVKIVDILRIETFLPFPILQFHCSD